jgi:hypothetical protein
VEGGARTVNDSAFLAPLIASRSLTPAELLPRRASAHTETTPRSRRWRGVARARIGGARPGRAPRGRSRRPVRPLRLPPSPPLPARCSRPRSARPRSSRARERPRPARARGRPRGAGCRRAWRSCRAAAHCRRPTRGARTPPHGTQSAPHRLPRGGDMLAEPAGRFDAGRPARAPGAPRQGRVLRAWAGREDQRTSSGSTRTVEAGAARQAGVARGGVASERSSSICCRWSWATFKGYQVRLHLCTVPGQIAQDKHAPAWCCVNVDGDGLRGGQHSVARLEDNDAERSSILYSNLRRQGRRPGHGCRSWCSTTSAISMAWLPVARVAARSSGFPARRARVRGDRRSRGMGVFETMKAVLKRVPSASWVIRATRRRGARLRSCRGARASMFPRERDPDGPPTGGARLPRAPRVPSFDDDE